MENIRGREALGGEGFSLFQNETLGGQRDFWYDNKEEHLCGSSYFPEHRSGLRMVPGLAQAPCLSRTV